MLSRMFILVQGATLYTDSTMSEEIVSIFILVLEGKIMKSLGKLHLTKSQQIDYHLFGNTLIRDYLNFKTTNSKQYISKETNCTFYEFGLKNIRSVL